MRENTLPIRSREFGLRVSACRLLIRRKALSDYQPSGFYRQGGLGILGFVGESQYKLRKEHVLRSASGGKETDSGVPTG